MTACLIDPRPPIRLRPRTNPTEVCEFCARKFYWVGSNANRFCSRACYADAQRHVSALTKDALRHWQQGLTAREIALLLTAAFRRKVTRNAVIGLAHRNGFPPRRSPIKRALVPTERAAA